MARVFWKSQMWKFLGSVGMCIVLAGCGNQAVKEMRGTEPPAEWKELIALDETLRGIGMNAAMEQWKASQAEVKPDVINPAIDAFAASTPPAGFEVAKRDAVVTAYKDLVAAAKGDTNTYAEKYKTLMAALQDLRAATATQN